LFHRRELVIMDDDRSYAHRRRLVQTPGAPHASTSSHLAALWQALASNDTIGAIRAGQSQKLYGREDDQRRMLEAYHRVKMPSSTAKPSVTSTTTTTMPSFQRQQQQQEPPKAELISILGDTGTGKTTLAQSLKKHVENDGGTFIWGRFGQMPRPDLYTAFREAMTDFVNQQQLRQKESVENIQQSLRRGGVSREKDGHILLPVIPALEHILPENTDNDSGNGPDSAPQQPEEEDGSMLSYLRSDPSTAAIRFKYVFRSFLQSICSPQQPLVLLLDELNWADEASLDLLAFLLVDSQIEGILFIITMQNVLKENVKRLINFSEFVVFSKISITDVKTLALSEREVGDLLATEFHMDGDDVLALAPIVHQHSGGNPFHIWRVLSLCAEQRLVRFHVDHFEWTSDEEVAKALRQTGNNPMMQYLSSRVAKLSDETREHVRIASCLGCRLYPEILQFFMSRPVDEFLAEVAECGIFEYSAERDAWSFAHDIVQETIYKEMIHPDDRIGYQ